MFVVNWKLPQIPDAEIYFFLGIWWGRAGCGATVSSKDPWSLVPQNAEIYVAFVSQCLQITQQLIWSWSCSWCHSSSHALKPAASVKKKKTYKKLSIRENYFLNLTCHIFSKNSFTALIIRPFFTPFNDSTPTTALSTYSHSSHPIDFTP